MLKAKKIKESTQRNIKFFENNNFLEEKEDVFEKDIKKIVISFYENNKNLTYITIDNFLKIPIKLYTINEMKRPVIKRKRKQKTKSSKFFQN